MKRLIDSIHSKPATAGTALGLSHSAVRGLTAAIALACAASPSLANDADEDAARSNQYILALWQASTGEAPPAIVKDSKTGETKLDWKFSPVIDIFKTEVKTAGNQQVNSPFANVEAHSTGVGINMTATGADNSVTQFNAALLASNSRSVLSRYNSQVTSLQLGRTTSKYTVAVGDVTANFSQLGSTLGLRGFYGQLKLDPVTLSMHAGTVAESWEALTNRSALDNQPARRSYLRDVVGVKAERVMADWITVFLTAQGYNDRDSSLANDGGFLKPAETQSFSAGAQVRQGAFNGAVEAATSRFSEKASDAKRASALTLNGTYALNPAQLRFGYNQVKNGFVSLASAAPPGAREGFVGAEWPVNDWLSWGTEVRLSQYKTPVTLSVPATKRDTTALTNRFGFNLSKWVQGLNFSLQDMYSEQKESTLAKRKQDNWNSQLSYFVNGWNTSLGLGWGKVESLANPQEDSRSTQWQMGVSRSYNFTQPNGQSAGALNVGVNLGQQFQKMVAAGTKTSNGMYGLTVSGQLPSGMSVNGNYSYGLTKQPFGGADLKTHQGTLDATYTFTPTANVKLYGRKTRRNVGQPTLETTENGYGLVLTYIF